MTRDARDDRDLSEDWIAVAEAAGMIGGTEEDVRRLVRMRRIQWREAEYTVCLDDVITVLELREFDAVMDGGGSEREARRRAEGVRRRLEAGGSGQEAGGTAERESGRRGERETKAIANCKLEIGNCKLVGGRKVVSVAEAAGMLGVTKWQVWKRCAGGRLNWDMGGRHRRR